MDGGVRSGWIHLNSEKSNTDFAQRVEREEGEERQIQLEDLVGVGDQVDTLYSNTDLYAMPLSKELANMNARAATVGIPADESCRGSGLSNLR